MVSADGNKHAHMINEQSAEGSALKGQPVLSPGRCHGLWTYWAFSPRLAADKALSAQSPPT